MATTIYAMERCEVGRRTIAGRSGLLRGLVSHLRLQLLEPVQDHYEFTPIRSGPNEDKALIVGGDVVGSPVLMELVPHCGEQDAGRAVGEGRVGRNGDRDKLPVEPATP